MTDDLTNNYWGTTDSAQIQQWIFDINDDPSVQATVLYDPSASDALPVEDGKKSLGGLKAMFR